jgi:hypothetical protein
LVLFLGFFGLLEFEIRRAAKSSTSSRSIDDQDLTKTPQPNQNPR